VVYHARYLEMAERSRNRILASLGFGVRDLFDASLALVLRRAALEFRRPALVGDLLHLSSDVTSASPARLVWRSLICRGSEVLCAIDAELVCMNRVTRHLIALPQALVDSVT
jgi:acyl-CoA thioester hydrolase